MLATFNVGNRNDINTLWDVTPLMDVNHFAELFVATLACLDNNKSHDKTKINCYLPENYLAAISEVLVSEDVVNYGFIDFLDIAAFSVNKDEYLKTLEIAILSKLNNPHFLAGHDDTPGTILFTISYGELLDMLSSYDEELQDKMLTFCGMMLNYARKPKKEETRRKSVFRK